MTKAEYQERKAQRNAEFKQRVGMTQSEYFKYKKDLASQYSEVPENTYTIDIPGMSDFFKTKQGRGYDPKLKRERYMRFKTAKSPVPEIINWIPGVINKLDDAQDLLYTALFIGKFFMRKIAPRFIPYVGWLLLINDLMNLGTNMLGMAMTPGLTKPCLRKTLIHAKRPKRLIRDLFHDFVAPSGWRRWLGFALQAPQALVTVTGYGLQLGSLMGFISDSLWSVQRKAMGDKIVWRSPPPSDPVSKAHRYLSQGIDTHNMQDVLTPEEHATLILAHNAALSIVFDSGIPLDLERTNQIQDLPVMTFEPWELSTLEVLEEMGVDLRDDIESFTPIYEPTYDQIIQEGIREWPAWETNMRSFVNESNYDWWSTVYQVYTEASYDVLEKATGVLQDNFTEENYILKACAEMAALDIMPLIPPSKEQLSSILSLALIKARARDAAFPTAEDWKTSVEEICGPVVSKMQRITKDLEWTL